MTDKATYVIAPSKRRAVLEARRLGLPQRAAMPPTGRGLAGLGRDCTVHVFGPLPFDVVWELAMLEVFGTTIVRHQEHTDG